MLASAFFVVRAAPTRPNWKISKVPVPVVYASPPVSGGKRKRYLWPASVAWHVPDATSHILRVLSEDPDTMVSPLGEKLRVPDALARSGRAIC